MKFFATFTSLYLTTIPLVLLPIVRKHFSSDFFDLFALIFVIQSLIMILELGLTNILIKLVGDTRKKIVSSSKLFSFAFVLCIYVVLIGFLLTFFITLNYLLDYISIPELKYDFLICLVLIGCSRFLAAIPRIILYGYEIFAGTSLIIIFLSSIRFIAPLTFYFFNDLEQMSFFYIYMLLSFLEGIVLWIYLEYKIQLIEISTGLFSLFNDSLFVFKKYWQTAIYTFIPSLMWLLSSQGDKAFYISDEGLKGSGMIVAISGLASGILILINSINTAFMPRLVATEPHSLSQRKNFFQMICIGLVLLLSLSIGIIFFSHKLLIFWFQDSLIDLNYAKLLQIYFLFFSVLALSSYFYVYFFIHDILKYHLAINLIYTFFMLLIWLKAANLSQYMQLMCFNALLCLVFSALFLSWHNRHNNNNYRKNLNV